MYIVLGFLLVFRGQRRAGAIVTVGSAIWFVGAYSVILRPSEARTTRTASGGPGTAESRSRMDSIWITSGIRSKRSRTSARKASSV